VDSEYWIVDSGEERGEEREEGKGEEIAAGGSRRFT